MRLELDVIGWAVPFSDDSASPLAHLIVRAGANGMPRGTYGRKACAPQIINPALLEDEEGSNRCEKCQRIEKGLPMGETTKIEWARSSWNPWIGCSPVSPACDHCYAEAWARRNGRDFARRRRTALANWKKPLGWDSVAEWEQRHGKLAPGAEWTGTPGFWPVFPSLCDPFDNEVPAEWRADFFDLISQTPHLTWLLLTKRIGNAERMIAEALPRLTAGRYRHMPWPWPHVWLGSSVAKQPEADRDLPKLLRVPAAKWFVSYEPALGPIDFTRLLAAGRAHAGRGTWQGEPRIDQIIVGGESSQGGKKARPFNLSWAHEVVRQCREAGVSAFVKQLGSSPVMTDGMGIEKPLKFKSLAGKDPEEWPAGLRVREFPI